MYRCWPIVLQGRGLLKYEYGDVFNSEQEAQSGRKATALRENMVGTSKSFNIPNIQLQLL